MSNIVLSEKLSFKIFSYLDINSLYRATQVCKSWQPFAENILYKSLVSKYFPKSFVVNNENTDWKLAFARFKSYSNCCFIKDEFEYSYLNTQLNHPIFQIEFNGKFFIITTLDADQTLTRTRFNMNGKVINTYFVQANEWIRLNDTKACILEEGMFAIRKKNNQKIVQTHSTNIFRLIANQDFFITTSGEKTVQIWDMEGNSVKTLSHQNNTGNVLISIPKTNFLITTSEFPNRAVEIYKLHLWDIKSGQCLKTLEIPTTGKIHSCIFYKGFLFVGAHGGLIFICDSDLNLIKKFKSETTFSISSLHISNKWIVAGDVAGFVHCWNVKDDPIMSESVEKIHRSVKRLKIV